MIACTDLHSPNNAFEAIAAARGFGAHGLPVAALLERPGPTACRCFAVAGLKLLIVRLGCSAFALLDNEHVDVLARWVKTQQGLTQLIVPCAVGRLLLELESRPPIRQSSEEMFAQMTRLKTECRSGPAIERASSADLEVLAPLYAVNPFNVSQFLPFPDRFRLALETGRFYFIRSEEGCAGGACHTLPEAADLGLIMGVVTGPNFRGRGWGKALMERLCHDLLQNGLKPSLFYEASNPVTRTLYRSLGFEDAAAFLTIDLRGDVHDE